MKKNKIFLSFLLAAAMTGCINDADIDSDNPAPPVVQKGGVVFSFTVPNSSGGRSVEDSGIYDKGSADEYKMNNVRIYLFNSTTKNIVKSFNVTLGAADTSTDVVKYTSPDKFSIDPGTYDLYAVANRTTAINAPTVDVLLSNIDSESYATGSISSAEKGLIMSNRGTANQNIQITQPATSDQTTNVTVRMERAVAKLMLAKGKENFELTDDKGAVYATINLSNYRYFNLSKKFYTFRHVATIQDGNDDTYLIEPNYTVTPEFFGDVPSVNGYVIDPYFFKKTVAGAPDFVNQDGYYAQPFYQNAPENITSTLNAAGSYTSIYCLENNMYRPAQKRDYTTGIVFKGSMSVPTSRTFNEAGENVEANSQTKLFYFNYNFYTSLKAVHDVGHANVPENESDLTPEMQKKYGIKIFTKSSDGSFACYYNYLIQHEKNSGFTMGVMEFSIVRNNIYKVMITSIDGLGTGTPDVEPGVDDKYKAYLNVDFAIYPWIVREDNNGNLE